MGLYKATFVAMLSWLCASRAMNICRRSIFLGGFSSGLGCVRPAAAFISPAIQLPTAPRQELTTEFAVLLMRTSYNVVDELDFVAMDQFQRQFFLLRQDEWNLYREAASKQGLPLTQGQLTEPNYFDFISFAQYKTINACLRDPKVVFEEVLGADASNKTVVYRSGDINDSSLADEHSKRVGNVILDYVLERDKVDTNDVATAATQLLGWLIVFGFALEATASYDIRDQLLTCSLVAPANLWGLKNLKNERLNNDFATKLLLAYFRRAGIPATVAGLGFNKITTTHKLKVLMA